MGLETLPPELFIQVIQKVRLPIIKFKSSSFRIKSFFVCYKTC